MDTQFNKRANIIKSSFLSIILLTLVAPLSSPSFAHHILGRPSYGLSEDSTTPPAKEIEAQLEHFYISAMTFPAFPSPDQHGRINIHIYDSNNSKPYNGTVSFKVRYDSIFYRGETLLGKQPIDDNVYRQGFVFEDAGDYIVSAEFIDQGKPYKFEFPLQVSGSASLNNFSIIISILAMLLFIFSIVKRQQLRKLIIKQHPNSG